MFGATLTKALGLLALTSLATAAPIAEANSQYGNPPHYGKPPHPNTTYPSKDLIGKIFNYLHVADITSFRNYLDPNVVWTVEGTHPLAGTYHGRNDFITNTLEYLAKLSSKSNPVTISTVNIIGGGNEEWSAQELSAEGLLVNGFKFDIKYSWNTRWSPGPNSKIVEARAYLDSEEVKQAIDSNVHPNPPDHKYSDNR